MEWQEVGIGHPLGKLEKDSTSEGPGGLGAKKHFLILKGFGYQGGMEIGEDY